MDLLKPRTTNTSRWRRENIIFGSLIYTVIGGPSAGTRKSLLIIMPERQRWRPAGQETAPRRTLKKGVLEHRSVRGLATEAGEQGLATSRVGGIADTEHEGHGAIARRGYFLSSFNLLLGQGKQTSRTIWIPVTLWKWKKYNLSIFNT